LKQPTLIEQTSNPNNTLIEQTSNPNNTHIYFIVEREIPYNKNKVFDSVYDNDGSHYK
jgi:hypothetical protein